MKKRLIKVIIRDVLLLLILVGYYFFNKYTGIYIPCIIREITGYKCPGCGITHLVFSLLQLDFHKAFTLIRRQSAFQALRQSAGNPPSGIHHTNGHIAP